ncbi:hypothetical protein H4R34_004346 [Dimargaris verticillata]|uniref:Uncharacterized protein n=1 Tax=Dimargaris verticillata TaxID=2761393 RepID=A0A9W8B4I0_9FUNG|nr:hypothetical protein H4R34_004346 [Dimargaris verticillata]
MAHVWRFARLHTHRLRHGTLLPLGQRSHHALVELGRVVTLVQVPADRGAFATRSLSSTSTVLSTTAKAWASTQSQAPTAATESSQLQPPSDPVPVLSHFHGRRDLALHEVTVGQVFDQQVRAHGDRLALVVSHEGVRLTYSQLDQQVNQVACALYDQGLRAGDRLGVFMTNNLAWLVLQYATSKLGIILVTINPAYRLHELEYALNLVGCKALVLSPSFKKSDYITMVHELVPEIATADPSRLTSTKVPSLRAIFVVDSVLPAASALSPALNWRELPGLQDYQRLVTAPISAESAQALNHPSLQCMDVVNIQFTSGTTGSPKAAALSHRNLLNNGYFAGQNLGYTPDDVVCSPVPLYHCFGLVLGNLACLTHGAALVLPSPAFDAEATLQAVAAERCTALYGVPTMFIEEMTHPNFSKYDLSSLRTGIMSGSPCPIEVMREVIDKMHAAGMTIAYGMTETSPLSFMTSPTDKVERRVSTVGQLLPHVEVKIIDSATGETVPIGVPGEVCVRGFGVMRGYWNDPTNTVKAIDQDGWMHSGDTGLFDQSGYLQIVGRTKDMIIRGGENLYPSEIENCLFEHPNIQNVAVVGVPDKRFGEEACACIIPNDPEKPVTRESIREYCRDRLAHYKIPRYILTMDSFPKTITGKIKRNVLRDMTCEKLGLN